ncbi:MAG: DUF488 domain-containing protein [Cytophagaceae bacterium]|nr:DUF488 domain-containing protein [Cytophagaceae bacterium]
MKKNIWTIGHSTRSIDDFIQLLKAFDIQHLIDIRRFPGSRRFPHFNMDSLRLSLNKNGIGYTHSEKLGGRRKPLPDSSNMIWKNESFRGYADYMATDEFKNAITALEKIAADKNTVYMCSEGLWTSCHRAMVSDYLKSLGWNVLHIVTKTKAQEHPYTSPARIVQGRLFY